MKEEACGSRTTLIVLDSRFWVLCAETREFENVEYGERWNDKDVSFWHLAEGKKTLAGLVHLSLGDLFCLWTSDNYNYQALLMFLLFSFSFN